MRHGDISQACWSTKGIQRTCSTVWRDICWWPVFNVSWPRCNFNSLVWHGIGFELTSCLMQRWSCQKGVVVRWIQRSATLQSDASQMRSPEVLLIQFIVLFIPFIPSYSIGDVSKIVQTRYRRKAKTHSVQVMKRPRLHSRTSMRQGSRDSWDIFGHQFCSQPQARHYISPHQ